MNSGELAYLIVRLKLRLMRPQNTLGRVLTSLVAGMAILVSVAAVVLIIGLRASNDRDTTLAITFTAVGLAWFGLTIVLGGGEGTLDPTRFALFPIEAPRLVAGLLAAAFLGAPAAVTAIAALATLSHASSPVTGILMLLAVSATTVGAVLSGRVANSAMSGLLRGRRTKELAGGVAIMVGLSVGSIAPVFGEYSALITMDRLDSVRGYTRFLPWGWGPEAIGRLAVGDARGSLLFLLLSIAFAVALWQVWSSLIARLLTTRGVAEEGAVGAGLVPRWMGAFGDRPIVAVWARSLHQMRRDPREFLEIAGFLPMMVIFALPALEAIRNGDDRAVLSSSSLGLALGLTSLNMFGADGRSFGVDALAVKDFRSVLVGKSLARLTLGVPIILILAVGLSALTGGWRYIFPSLAIGLTGLFSMTAVGMFVSTRFPFALPSEMSMASGKGIEGCATGLIRMVALITAMVVASPGVAATTVIALSVSASAATVVGLASIGYGLMLFLISARKAGEWASGHIPEMFGHLSTRS